MYIWIYILAACGVLSLGIFFLTLNRDSKLMKKLKLKKSKILVNWLLLLVSIICFTLVFYLFKDIQQQINLLGL